MDKIQAVLIISRFKTSFNNFFDSSKQNKLRRQNTINIEETEFRTKIGTAFQIKNLNYCQIITKMNTEDDPNDLQSNPAIEVNGKLEESCIILEENISVVEIVDDTVQDETSFCNEEKIESITIDEEEGEITPNVHELPSEFQVIDEVGCSQDDGASVEIQDGDASQLNGVS